jgi:hypothetical protein
MLYPAKRIVVSKNLYVRNISVLALFSEVDSRINGRINVQITFFSSLILVINIPYNIDNQGKGQNTH